MSPSISKYDFKQYFKVVKILKEAKLDHLDATGVRFLYKNFIKAYNFSKILFPIYFRLKNK